MIKIHTSEGLTQTVPRHLATHSALFREMLGEDGEEVCAPLLDHQTVSLLFGLLLGTTKLSRTEFGELDLHMMRSAEYLRLSVVVDLFAMRLVSFGLNRIFRETDSSYFTTTIPEWLIEPPQTHSASRSSAAR